MTSGKSPLVPRPKWGFMSVSGTLQIHLCITSVGLRTSGSTLITMLNMCPQDILPFACLLFTFCLNVPFPALCSYCIKCDCFTCSGSTHRLRPALILCGSVLMSESFRDTLILSIWNIFNFKISFSAASGLSIQKSFMFEIWSKVTAVCIDEPFSPNSLLSDSHSKNNRWNHDLTFPFFFLLFLHTLCF